MSGTYMDADSRYLLEVDDDGRHVLMVRDDGPWGAWSAPVELAAVPAEVCS